MRDGFLSYDFQSGEVFGFEESLHVRKHGRDGDSAPASVILPVVLLLYHIGVSWATL